VLWDASQDDDALVRSIEARVQQDFESDLEKLQRITQAETASGYRASGIPEYILIRLSLKGDMRAWSSQQYVPSAEVIRQQLANPLNEIFVERNMVFYNLKLKTDSCVYFRLLPLRVAYPIKNEHLSDFVYLGSFNRSDRLEKETVGKRFSLLPLEQSINIKDSEGITLFSVSLPDLSSFRFPIRLAAVVCILAALFIACIAAYAHTHRHGQSFQTGSYQAEAYFLGAIVSARCLLWLFDFPYGYVQLEFFSSELLALNGWNASLGDLLLNAILLATISYRLYRAIDPEQMENNIAQYGVSWWFVFHFALLGFTLACFYGFFEFFEALTLNSKIAYDFSDLFRLNLYSLFLYLAVALVVVSIFIWLHFWVGVSRRLSRQLNVPPQRVWLFMLGGLPLVILLNEEWAEIPAYLAFCAIPLGLRLYTESDESLSFRLVPALLLLAVMAALTNLGISKSLRQGAASQLDHYADRFAISQDFITEYIFDEVIENISNDRTLWSTDSVRTEKDAGTIPQETINQIVSNHLITNFKGYDFQVFAFDEQGKRLDTQYDLRHYTDLSYQRKREGRTLSDRLFYLPYDVKASRYIYVGYFPVYNPTLGRTFLQIEMHPKLSASSKLYPQLLIDQNLRQKPIPQSNYHIGIYQNGVLQKHEGNYSFPIVLSSPALTEGTLTETQDEFEYIKKVSDERTVMIRAPKRTLFDQLTAFSFLYYFYMLLLGAYLLPGFIRRVNIDGLSFFRNNFVFRLQFFMGVVGFLPLLALWLLSSSLFTRLYQEDAIESLRQNLRQVSDFLENDPTFMVDINSGRYPLAQSVATINRISNLLNTDINLYNLSGMLFSTTRPKIYQTALTSIYINPTAYAELSKGTQRELIVEEQIGRLKYFSGFVPLFDFKGRQRGYLNLPYLSQQSVMETQVKRFVGYLINLYVVLLLGIILAGIFITRSLTRPLLLLRQKIETTKFGKSNEPLQWNSHDEIGSIINSYNQMLQSLEDSEEKLAKNERELAWRQMAQQIAHEIKNPLTPMKLSIQHLLSTLQKNDRADKNVIEKVSNTLLNEIETLSNIAGSFTQFATMPVAKQSPVALNKALQQVLNLYSESKEAEVLLKLPQHTIHILGDADQLHRVLMNLVKNALQAMPPDKRGLVAIVLVQEGVDAIITIADNGVGIPEAVQSRVFEPSFSTKTSGMGLGLAITRRLVESMGGSISFTTEPAVGTTFTLTFPVYVLPKATPPRVGKAGDNPPGARA